MRSRGHDALSCLHATAQLCEGRSSAGGSFDDQHLRGLEFASVSRTATGDSFFVSSHKSWLYEPARLSRLWRSFKKECLRLLAALQPGTSSPKIFHVSLQPSSRLPPYLLDSTSISHSCAVFTDKLFDDLDLRLRMPESLVKITYRIVVIQQ